jgi:hypothetical protein
MFNYAIVQLLESNRKAGTLSTKDLIRRYIKPDPRRGGFDEARVEPSGVKIWAVICSLQPDLSNIHEVMEGYDLPREAVEASIAYYGFHKEVIDNRISANNY